MNILYLNFFLIIVYGFLFLNRYAFEKYKYIFLTLTTVQLVLFNGLRHMSIGVDTFRYARHFYRIQDINSLSQLLDYDMEIGFVIFNRVIGLFFNHQVAFLLAATVIFGLFAFVISKYSKNIFLSYLIFISLGFFESTFNTMRQSIAISITLLAFYFAMKKKPQFFFITIIIATSFHISALIAIPIYFLMHYQLDTIKILIISFVYMILLTFRHQIGEIFTRIYYGDSASILMDMYDSSGGIGGTTLALIFFFILFTISHRPMNNKGNRLLNATYNINILAIFIQTLSSFSYLFTRLNFYYLIYLVIYIPLLFEPTEHSFLKNYDYQIRFVKSIMLTVIVLFLGYSYLNDIGNNLNNLLPFRFGWEL